MKLTHFEIQSYRSCAKTRLPINPELTTLIGVNGSGKSNILNAILLLRKMCRSRYIPSREREIAFKECKVIATFSHGNKKILMRSEIRFQNDTRNVDEVLVSNTKWNFRGIKGDEKKWHEFPIEAMPYFSKSKKFVREIHMRAYSIRWAKNQLPNEAQGLFRRLSDFLFGINYYSASQFADPSRCPISIELEDGKPVRLTRTLGHEQFIMDLHEAYTSKKNQYQRYLNIIGSSGIGLVDKIHFNEIEMPSSSYEVQAGGNIKQIKKHRLLIVPSFLIGESNLSPNQLSEGTFKTLALLFYLMTDESQMLLIEEPEVCIHHGLLNSVIALIKNQSKHKQIIISTHSDFVLDHLAPENLVLVKRSPDVGTTASSLTKVLSANDFKALKNYLMESGNLGEYWREGGFEND